MCFFFPPVFTYKERPFGTSHNERISSLKTSETQAKNVERIQNLRFPVYLENASLWNAEIQPPNGDKN